MDITDFSFENGLPDPDELTRAWLPEIEKAASAHVAESKLQIFFIAALRVGAKSRGLANFNLKEVIELSGYSKSTFFRIFEGHTAFMYEAYLLTAKLSFKVFEKHLVTRERSLEDVARFTTEMFYGANCTVPSEFTELLWEEHGGLHSEFHPHLVELPPILLRYLRNNGPTQHLNISEAELLGVIQTLDWDMLNARIDPSKTFPSVEQYDRLRKMFYGMLVASAT